ncbi:B3 domain-containing protein IDEF1 isoform X1 [Zea mays]|uniref:Putative B3 DNA binding domain family protein n=1 Tax=Zea mays TaxID=4577 RepID=A0A1D6LDA6_MAIZE|nr:B3 domain-containing protein IDEF1 isoform X1 [Zea mays]AQK78010.1 Putative B3 DNA binding domain family protein [Zea mays]|eukprot:XP_020395340.1 B3 domain-containing protein IDEF1 isoform X1 [Zea mays]
MGQMGGPDGDGPHHQYHYQALLAAVQNPSQGLHVPLHAGAGAPAAGPGPRPGADADASSTHNANATPHSQPPRAFTDWSASNSAFAAQPAPATTNTPFHYNLSQSYALWTHYMLNKNVSYSTYSTPHEPLRHTHIPDKYSGCAFSLGFDSFTTMSLGPNICANMTPMERSISAKEPENSEDLPTVVRSSDEMDTRNSGDVRRDTVDTLPESKQSHESCASVSNKFDSGEYQVILRKELTKSDVANSGRIVLPKKDAEAGLPPLVQGDPLILQMDDMVLPIIWKFKYRFWPNNKSRMYILEAAGEFVKTHGLQAGDTLIIYKNSVPGKFIIRGEKSIQQTNL